MSLRTAALYAQSAARVAARRKRGRGDDRHVFVVGSPRSGTSYLAGVIGAQPDVVDLGEVHPLKAAIPELARLPQPEAARRLRAIVQRVRTLGLVRHLRAVEQTPETAFVLEAALAAFPRARAVHIVRDGRDVVCSLLERGWLSARAGTDDAGLAYGTHARFWVEPDRAQEFARASDATRAAWAWRRYVSAGGPDRERVLVLRYETLVRDRAAAAGQLAEHLDLDAGRLERSLGDAFTSSVGRWRAALTPEQLADVEREAGVLLAELGYT